MKVPGTTIAALVFDILIGLAIPAVLYLYFRRKEHCDRKPFWIGCLTFPLFALMLESLAHSLILSGPAGAVIQGNHYLMAVYGGLMAGLFEETGRYLFCRWLLKKNLANDRNALMYGAGHGGIEVITVMVLNMINYLVYAVMLNSGSIDQLTAGMNEETLATFQTILASLAQTPSWTLLISPVERIAAVAAHISFACLIWQAVKQKRLAFYGMAVALHFALDALTVIATAWTDQVLILEGIVYLITAGIILLTRKLTASSRNAEEPAA